MKCNYGRGISVTKMEDPSMLHKHSLYIDNRRSEMGAFFMPKNIYGEKGGIYGIYGI